MVSMNAVEVVQRQCKHTGILCCWPKVLGYKRNRYTYLLVEGAGLLQEVLGYELLFSSQA